MMTELVRHGRRLPHFRRHFQVHTAGCCMYLWILSLFRVGKLLAATGDRLTYAMHPPQFWLGGHSHTPPHLGQRRRESLGQRRLFVSASCKRQVSSTGLPALLLTVGLAAAAQPQAIGVHAWVYVPRDFLRQPCKPAPLRGARRWRVRSTTSQGGRRGSRGGHCRAPADTDDLLSLLSFSSSHLSIQPSCFVVCV